MCYTRVYMQYKQGIFHTKTTQANLVSSNFSFSYRFKENKNGERERSKIFSKYQFVVDLILISDNAEHIILCQTIFIHTGQQSLWKKDVLFFVQS